jgi:hypothetical protein
MASQNTDGQGELPPCFVYGEGAGIVEPHIVLRDDSNGPGGNAVDPNVAPAAGAGTSDY